MSEESLQYLHDEKNKSYKEGYTAGWSAAISLIMSGLQGVVAQGPIYEDSPEPIPPPPPLPLTDEQVDENVVEWQPLTEPPSLDETRYEKPPKPVPIPQDVLENMPVLPVKIPSFGGK